MEKQMNRKRQLNEREQLKSLRKALLVTHVSGFVPQFEMNNVRILQSMGYEVHYASNFNTPSYGTDNHRLDGTGIICHQIDFVRSPFDKRNFQVYRQMVELMRREDFSLVHCHTPMGGVMARLAAHVTGTGPVIYTAHGFHFFKGASWKNWLFYYPMEKFLSRYTDQQICINREDYELAKRKFHAKYVDYVPGVGIDGSQFRTFGDKERQKKRESLGILSGQVVLLTSGEMIRQYGEDYFRERESATLKKYCRGNGMVISTGGGIVVREENWPVLRENSLVVYLDRPLHQLAKKDRPMTAALGVEELYRQRGWKYEKVANLVISNNREFGLREKEKKKANAKIRHQNYYMEDIRRFADQVKRRVAKHINESVNR